MTATATLITQLRVLGQLTRTEAQVARLRTAQATGDGARDALRRNAADADERAARIDGALHDLGALPDPVTPVLGRVAVLVRGALEQAQPLDEALFADLALEHQLRDRARHVGALADAAGLPAVRALADDLVAAHDETVGWLHGVLDDVAAGRPAALAASPLQRVAEQVTRTANAPALGTSDPVAAAPGDAASMDAAPMDAAPVGAARVAAAPADAAEVAVDAAAPGGQASEEQPDHGEPAPGQPSGDEPADGRAPAGRSGEDGQVPAEEEPAEDEPAAAEEPGGGQPTADPAAPPLPGFADLSAQAAVAALRTLDPGAARAALTYERAHGNRPAVVAAARIRAGAEGDDQP